MGVDVSKAIERAVAGMDIKAGQDAIRVRQEQIFLNPTVQSLPYPIEVNATAVKNLADAEDTLKGAPPKTLRAFNESLETIRSISRPVWAMCNSQVWMSEDKFGWGDYFNSLKESLAATSRATGMFVRYYEKDGKQQLRDLGATAFVVAKNTIVTNRHVVVDYAYRDIAGWHFSEGAILKVRFPFEYSKCNPRKSPIEVKVKRVIWIDPTDPDADYAILETEDTQLPAPVVLARTPSTAEGAKVATIGYPNRPQPCVDLNKDPNSQCTFLSMKLIDQLFATPDKESPFPVQRISAGYVLPADSESQIYYDSSTWNGNSGSPLISLVDGRVVGIHFQGRSGETANEGYNVAIPSNYLYSRLLALGLSPP